MRVSRSLIRDGKCSLRCASIVLCLFIGLAALLVTPAESAAHPLHVSAVASTGASAVVRTDAAGNEDLAGLESRSSPAGLGGGCSLVGLDAVRHIALPRVTTTGNRLRPVSMEPAQDLALTPPCPPPTRELRVTLD
jgi:hypothetical protein